VADRRPEGERVCPQISQITQMLEERERL